MQKWPVVKEKNIKPSQKFKYTFMLELGDKSKIIKNY